MDSHKILQVAKIYEETKSLTATGKQINLSKERVRQMLLEGKQMGLIDYVPADQERSQNFKSVTEKYSKEQIVEALKSHDNMFKGFQTLGLTRRMGKILLKHYGITKADYHTDKFRAKYIEEYVALQDKLGHHPSTTELQSDAKTRTLYNALCKYWGGIQQFRAEFGVSKKQHFMSKAGYLNWLKSTERGKQTKQLNAENHKKDIVQVLSQNEYLTRNDLVKAVKLSPASVANYVTELSKDNVLITQNLGQQLFYKVNLLNPKSMLYLKQEQEETLSDTGYDKNAKHASLSSSHNGRKG